MTMAYDHVAPGKDTAELALQETASMSRKAEIEAFGDHKQITVSSSQLLLYYAPVQTC